MALSNQSHRICQCKVVLVGFCWLYLLLLSLQLQAGTLTCEHCNREYNSEEFSSCPACNPTPPQPSPPAQATSQNSLQLVIELFRLAAQALDGTNFAFSPDSLFQALSLLLMGADGNTHTLLENYLDGAGHTPSDAELNENPEHGDVYSIGNCLLLSSGHQLQQTYREQLGKMNAAVRDNIDFTNVESLQELAQQLNQQFCVLTHGMIPSFCDARQWDPSTSLALINSVYFNGEWENHFNSVEGGGFFRLPDGQYIRLNRILSLDIIPHAQYASHEGWDAVAVPYTGAHEMVLVLPPSGAMPNQVSAPIITGLFSSLHSTSVGATLPPFEINSNLDLNPALTGTGLSCLFQPGGVSLGAMLAGSSGSMSVSHVRQSCGIKVNERGTEAGAVTVIGVAKGIDQHFRVNFNRPFLYILRHKETGRILFIGQILNPEARS